MRRNVKTVPVLDAEGNTLYTIDRNSAVELLVQGKARSVRGRAIQIKPPLAQGRAARMIETIAIKSLTRVQGGLVKEQ